MATATSNGKHVGFLNGAVLNGAHLNGAREPEPLPAPVVSAAAEGGLSPLPPHSARAFRPSAKLLGKVAIITGADSGIGRAVALAYAREGADVAMVYCTNAAAARQTRAGVEDTGRRALTIQGDVSDEAFCKSAVKQVVKELGQLDILVSNASVEERTDDVQTLSRGQLERTFGVNVFSYIFMVQACLPFMQAGGAIIATGSEAGIFGSHQLPEYSATKGAIHALTRSLAQQLLPRGIRVNAVAPGPVRAAPGGPRGLLPEANAELGASDGEQQGRVPEADEVATAYVFFASNADSGLITGQVLAELGMPAR